MCGRRRLSLVLVVAGRRREHEEHGLPPSTSGHRLTRQSQAGTWTFRRPFAVWDRRPWLTFDVHPLGLLGSQSKSLELPVLLSFWTP